MRRGRKIYLLLLLTTICLIISFFLIDNIVNKKRYYTIDIAIANHSNNSHNVTLIIEKGDDIIYNQTFPMTPSGTEMVLIEKQIQGKYTINVIIPNLFNEEKVCSAGSGYGKIGIGIYNDRIDMDQKIA